MILALDIGSSSVKAAVLDGTEIVGAVASAEFVTEYAGDRAEVPVERIDAAIKSAVGKLNFSQIDAVGLTGMGPAWVAMDERGDALTPVVTHQDRRSLEQARRIEAKVGRERHLRLSGNRPTPGGISSTVAAWFADGGLRPARMGHLPTYLMRRLTGAWAIDPSNAGFTGLMDVSTGDWSSKLSEAANVNIGSLPPIVDAAEIVGNTIANDYGIPAGLPMFGGYVDGSGPILLTGGGVGTLVHVAGSTDVLAACLGRPTPREGLLCRPLGTGGKWVSAATQAAGAAGLDWARRLLGDGDDFAAVLSEALDRDPPTCTFRPHLAGDRQSVEQPTGGFDGLTLAHGRLDLLAAVARALVADHADRLARLLTAAESAGATVRPIVVTTGGGELLAGPCRAAWPARPDGEPWRFEAVDQATLRGLGMLRMTV